MASTTETELSHNCPECQSPLLWADLDQVCSNCGLVISEEDRLVQSSYQINANPFDMVHDRQFVERGNSLTYRMGGSFQQLKWHTDYKRAPIPAKLQAKLKRWNLIQKEARIRYHETEIRVGEMVKHIAEHLDLPVMVAPKAIYLYLGVKKTHAIRNNVSMMAACLYRACKELGVPLPIRNLIQAFLERGHRVNARLICRDLIDGGLPSSVSRPSDYIPQMVSKLRAVPDVRIHQKNPAISKGQWLDEIALQSEKIALYFERMVFDNINPHNTAAALVLAAEYKTLKEKGWRRVLTQKILAEVLDIDDYSIRDIFYKYCKRVFGGRRS